MGLDFWKPLLERRSPVAGLAQLVEQLICNHQVRGSTPLAGTISRPVRRHHQRQPPTAGSGGFSTISIGPLFGGSDCQVSAKFSADLSLATDPANICGGSAATSSPSRLSRKALSRPARAGFLYREGAPRPQAGPLCQGLPVLDERPEVVCSSALLL